MTAWPGPAQPQHYPRNQRLVLSNRGITHISTLTLIGECHPGNYMLKSRKTCPSLSDINDSWMLGYLSETPHIDKLFSDDDSPNCDSPNLDSNSNQSVLLQKISKFKIDNYPLSSSGRAACLPFSLCYLSSNYFQHTLSSNSVLKSL